ncbi:hypothetical protein [Pseudogemmobacter sonorensis]|uniref:hypothetical protein n=1 Tax=Pseudogemmobacter sonorensis TaxID=2989681 RepID=UPI0036CFE17B
MALPIAGAALAVPAIAKADSMTRQERIQHHAEALLALIRGEFPDDATSMCVIVNSNWGPVEQLNNRASVDARAMTTVWKDDDRMKNGGLWIENSLGHWAPGIGRY